ncbi:MAG: excinuclease ABC subunit UvrA [Minisyncoccia bacterium]|jgi:excinuclease ABC subunit A
MREDKIIIKGARVHNLKNISLQLPKNKIIVFTGVSGSGKSSLAFDTIFAEGQRRYIESLSPYARQFLGQMEKPDVDEIIGLSPAISIDQKALSYNPRSIVGTLTEIYDYLRVLYARLGELYCPNCLHKIEKLTIDEMVDIIKERAILNNFKKVLVLSPVVLGRKGEHYQILRQFLGEGFEKARIDGEIVSLFENITLSKYKNHTIEIVIDEFEIDDENRLFEAVELALSYSKGLVTVKLFDENNNLEFTLSSLRSCPDCGFSFPEIEPRLFSFNSPYGACQNCHGIGKIDFLSEEICPVCQGKRLKKEALSVKINNKNIWEVCSLTIDKCYEFFVDYESKLKEREKIIAKDVLKEIINRLSFLIDVGLDYLTLSREASTLSGGEAQRIRLASQIGSGLSNTLYVLDEPTIGLHERDTEKLINILKNLNKQNNTLIIVEHDEKTIFSSDFLVDLGPLAGKNGGRIVAIGYIKDILKDKNNKFPDSLTLKYLKGELKIEIPQKRRINKTPEIKIVKAKANNLKNITVSIPLRKFVCITGVSGSGKSTLLYDVLYENLKRIKEKNFNLINVKEIKGHQNIDRVIIIDQSPIGRTPRSTPATYTSCFTPIRDFFAKLPESRARGYTPSRFSFNVEVSRGGGRCEACKGAGYNIIEMHFLPPVLVKCDVCQGKRFNRETLQVKYKGKNISDILNMSIDEAFEFFKDIYTIKDKLKILKDVGLGYLTLGQPATTLSGGEAQRIKIARELNTFSKQKTLYLLDEPSVGLHYHDIKILIDLLNRLVDKGNTVVVIEHNMHIIKCADYIIDLGPEGGDKGGEVIACGTPEEIIKNEKSYTGKFLKKYLK